MGENIKIAIVTDFLKVYGGLERQLEGIMDIIPNADIFTTYYIPQNLPVSFRKFNIIEAKNKRILKHLSSFTIPIYPTVFENFSFEGYDLVISLTSGFAKSINTQGIRHISYILTPPRFLWNLPNSTQDRISFKFPLEIVNNYLRLKDFYSAQLPDKIMADSKTVQKRILKFYRRDSLVVYPFVDTEKFNISKDFVNGDEFLIISRLEKYKNIEMAIRVVNKLGVRLNIVGSGSYKRYLESISNMKYIKFYGNITDSYMIKLLNTSKALIFPGAEDFGLTPIEAQACGKAVIALNKDGVLETVIDKKTGYFFDDESGLEKIIKNFNSSDVDKIDCRQQSLVFSKDNFNHSFINNIFNT